MQTIKTSATVALLMTLLYGGYVSLTTPPEELPPEVAELLNEDLPIEGSLGSISATAENVNSPITDGLANASFESPILSSPEGAMATEQSAQTSSPALGGYSDLPNAPNVPSGTTPVQGVSFDAKKNDPPMGDFSLPNDVAVKPGTPTEIALDKPKTPQAKIELPDMDLSAKKATEAESGSAASISDQSTSMSLSDSNAANPKSSVDQTSTANPTGTASSPSANQGLENAIQTADRQYAKGQLAEALATLSVFYGMPNTSSKLQESLLARLDPLAREVIYSRRHLLSKPHRIGSNETLMEVAQRFQVPWQLLANINGIQDPLVTHPGTELKVVEGPFNAEVNLATNELTIFLGDLYAGRFPIATGNSPAPTVGTFTVQDKQSQRLFKDAQGVTHAPNTPGNVYGNMWIDLGGQLCIHGSPDQAKPTSKGCISLAGQFSDDLFGILSQGSSVSIVR